MTAAPPLRFVGVVLGGWIAARAVMLMPDPVQEVANSPPETPPARTASIQPPRQPEHWTEPSAAKALLPKEARRVTHGVAAAKVHGPLAAPSPSPAISFAFSPALPPAPPGSTVPLDRPTPPMQAGRPLVREVGRWSASAWAFVRRGSGAQLAAGGVLGGSQAGARMSYRLNEDAARPLAVSARFYSPLRDRRGAEAALGVEWKPLHALPITLLAERRQAIGRDGRSAFAAMVYGGVSERQVYGPVALDAYGQAGVVGARSRDLFVDGSAALNVPLNERGDLRIGATVWGAAQPGVSRLDVGPQVSYRLPIDGPSFRVTADWRLRVAGDAAPASGPALTLSTAF